MKRIGESTDVKDVETYVVTLPRTNMRRLPLFLWMKRRINATVQTKDEANQPTDVTAVEADTPNAATSPSQQEGGQGVDVPVNNRGIKDHWSE